LNKLQDSGNILVGLFWSPSKNRATLQDKILEIKEESQVDGPYINLIEKFDEQLLVRPTLIEINEFSWPFQQIVDTYSIPKYKEINPAIFTAVTFPFLFGVMFGDVMHGTILFVFGAYLCFSKSDPNSSMGMLGKVKYMLLLMGLFSTFNGFIYNDFTSVPLKAFGNTCWATYRGDSHAKPALKADCIYPVGVDPSWYMGSNELTYLNSLKMKISVILGVS
jgi:V-type H+-transporting ATPase subunit a